MNTVGALALAGVAGVGIYVFTNKRNTATQYRNDAGVVTRLPDYAPPSVNQQDFGEEPSNGLGDLLSTATTLFGNLFGARSGARNAAPSRANVITSEDARRGDYSATGGIIPNRYSNPITDYSVGPGHTLGSLFDKVIPNEAKRRGTYSKPRSPAPTTNAGDPRRGHFPTGSTARQPAREVRTSDQIRRQVSNQYNPAGNVLISDNSARRGDYAANARVINNAKKGGGLGNDTRPYSF